MRVIVVGAGHVGQAAVGSLHEAHDCTVIDIEAVRLHAMSHDEANLVMANARHAPFERADGGANDGHALPSLNMGSRRPVNGLCSQWAVPRALGTM